MMMEVDATRRICCPRKAWLFFFKEDVKSLNLFQEDIQSRNKWRKKLKNATG